MQSNFPWFAQEVCKRFEIIPMDTISNLWTNISMVVRLPAIFVITMIEKQPKWAHFLEFDCRTGEGFFSTVIGICLWITLIIIFGNIANLYNDTWYRKL